MQRNVQAKFDKSCHNWQLRLENFPSAPPLYICIAPINKIADRDYVGLWGAKVPGMEWQFSAWYDCVIEVVLWHLQIQLGHKMLSKYIYPTLKARLHVKLWTSGIKLPN